LPSALADGSKEFFNIRLQPKLSVVLAEADLFLIQSCPSAKADGNEIIIIIFTLKQKPPK